jgi:hypothetical protein
MNRRIKDAQKYNEITNRKACYRSFKEKKRLS